MTLTSDSGSAYWNLLAGRDDHAAANSPPPPRTTNSGLPASSPLSSPSDRITFKALDAALSTTQGLLDEIAYPRAKAGASKLHGLGTSFFVPPTTTAYRHRRFPGRTLNLRRRYLPCRNSNLGLYHPSALDTTPIRHPCNALVAQCSLFPHPNAGTPQHPYQLAHCTQRTRTSPDTHDEGSSPSIKPAMPPPPSPHFYPLVPCACHRRPYVLLNHPFPACAAAVLLIRFPNHLNCEPQARPHFRAPSAPRPAPWLPSLPV
ncbi:hypothetical protein B0H34DRAFT_801090 [Crassisporium funariophilum]|nr:hypothetical protein B0H34DRAFT_801090 [Crassisporium funariophilum]